MVHIGLYSIYRSILNHIVIGHCVASQLLSAGKQDQDR